MLTTTVKMGLLVERRAKKVDVVDYNAPKHQNRGFKLREDDDTPSGHMLCVYFFFERYGRGR
jgi:hypothetical protein